MQYTPVPLAMLPLISLQFQGHEAPGSRHGLGQITPDFASPHSPAHDPVRDIPVGGGSGNLLGVGTLLSVHASVVYRPQQAQPCT